MDIKVKNLNQDYSTIHCKITPPKFGIASYVSDEHHFKRVKLEEHYKDVIIDESKVIDEYTNNVK